MTVLVEQKPVDEAWQAKALVFVIAYTRRHGVAPTWRELALYMGWKPSTCRTMFRMLKLAKRGLRWVQNQERSLTVPDKSALQAWQRERKSERVCGAKDG